MVGSGPNKKRLLVFTDPFSDPLCDDHYAILYLEKFNNLNGNPFDIEYYISAINKVGSKGTYPNDQVHNKNLSTRAESISYIIQKKKTYFC